MIWAGSPFAQLIEFGTGTPAGPISYQLSASDGVTVLHAGTIVPEQGDVSALLIVEGDKNTVATPLFETRILTWNYTTATGVVSDRTVYRVNRSLPFAVSNAGVRNKLGVAEHELPDDNIDLVAAYAEMLVLMPLIDTVAAGGNRAALLAATAIEAQAALSTISSLQLRAARSETSGSDQFSRFEKIDWYWIAAELQNHIERAREAIDPDYEATGEDNTIFTTAPRVPDPLTGG